MTEITNMKKYRNYKEQMGRLKRALNSHFYLEAIFIEYAIMEDRLESALSHAGRWNSKPDAHISIDRKITLVEKLAEQKKSLAQKYFTSELTQGIRDWKEERNKMIHALLKQSIHSEDLLDIATKGQELVKKLCSKTNSFNRAIEKQKKER